MISLETPLGNGPHLPGGEYFLNFLELWQALSTYDVPVQFKLSCVADLLELCISLVFIIIHIKCDLPDEVQVPCCESSGWGVPLLQVQCLMRD